MKLKHFTGLAAIFLILTIITPAAAMTPQEIIDKTEELMEQADDSKGEMTMILVNKKGKQRVRQVRMYAKKGDPEAKSLMIFLSPADVKGTSFLSWNNIHTGEDQQWLYLPALERIRQISSSGKSESFMGTEFTYSDMAGRDFSKDNLTLLPEQKIDGADCYVIESSPKAEAEVYSRTITWVRKDMFIPVKTEFYDLSGNLLKVMTTADIKKIQGINTPSTVEMSNVQNGRKTIIRIDKIEYNANLQDDIFTQRNMKRGK